MKTNSNHQKTDYRHSMCSVIKDHTSVYAICNLYIYKAEFVVCVIAIEIHSWTPIWTKLHKKLLLRNGQVVETFFKWSVIPSLIDKQLCVLIGHTATWPGHACRLFGQSQCSLMLSCVTIGRQWQALAGSVRIARQHQSPYVRVCMVSLWRCVPLSQLLAVYHLAQ